MNFKKLITTLVVVLGAWVSVGVQAQVGTSYDFTVTFNSDPCVNAMGSGACTWSGPSTLKGALTLGTLSSGSVYNIASLSNGLANGSTTSTLTLNGNLYFDISANGFYSVTHAPSSNYVGYTFGGQSYGWNPTQTDMFNGYSSYGEAPYPTVSTSYVATSGAPEIDGSLAPKVGFLLGCLFLMFGRKKQNTEALMTA